MIRLAASRRGGPCKLLPTCTKKKEEWKEKDIKENMLAYLLLCFLRIRWTHDVSPGRYCVFPYEFHRHTNIRCHEIYQVLVERLTWELSFIRIIHPPFVCVCVCSSLLISSVIIWQLFLHLQRTYTCGHWKKKIVIHIFHQRIDTNLFFFCSSSMCMS